MDPAAAEAVAINWVDGAVVFIIVVCALLGLVTGFVLQLAGLLSVTVGIIASLTIGPLAADAIGRWIADEHVAALIAYIGCFSVAATTVRVLAAFLSTILRKLRLDAFDKVAGAGVGAVKGALIAAVLLVIGGAAGVDALRTPIRTSLVGSIVVGAADTVADWAGGNPVGRQTERAGAEILDTVREGQERFDKRFGQPGDSGTTEPGGRDRDARP